ncbi:hypothetical protein DENSPDRAFT_839522 [Dentipellis sp. KUC8613]|nr:hypothetical protein DENSPDRAFT_839522 [Dentipellis sp. KUC8613]
MTRQHDLSFIPDPVPPRQDRSLTCSQWDAQIESSASVLWFTQTQTRKASARPGVGSAPRTPRTGTTTFATCRRQLQPDSRSRARPIARPRLSADRAQESLERHWFEATRPRASMSRDALTSRVQVALQSLIVEESDVAAKAARPMEERNLRRLYISAMGSGLWNFGEWPGLGIGTVHWRDLSCNTVAAAVYGHSNAIGFAACDSGIGQTYVSCSVAACCGAGKPAKDVRTLK